MPMTLWNERDLPSAFSHTDEKETAREGELSLPTSPLCPYRPSPSSSSSSPSPQRDSSSPPSSASPSPPLSTKKGWDSRDNVVLKNKMLDMVQREARGSFRRSSSNASAASTAGEHSSGGTSPRPPSFSSSSSSAQRSSQHIPLHLHISDHSSSSGCHSPRPSSFAGNNACSSPLPSTTNSPRLATTPRRSMRRSLLPAAQLDAADLALLAALPGSAPPSWDSNASSSASSSSDDAAARASDEQDEHDEHARSPSACCSRTCSSEDKLSAPAQQPQTCALQVDVEHGGALLFKRREGGNLARRASSGSAGGGGGGREGRRKRLQSSFAAPGAFEWADLPPSPLAAAAAAECSCSSSPCAPPRAQYNKRVGEKLAERWGEKLKLGGGEEEGAGLFLRVCSNP